MQVRMSAMLLVFISRIQFVDHVRTGKPSKREVHELGNASQFLILIRHKHMPLLEVRVLVEQPDVASV